MGGRAFAARRNRIDAAAAGEHQTVHRADAGDGDEEVQDVADDVAEDVRKGNGRALFDQLRVRCTAGHADVVQQVGGDDDDAADCEGFRKIALRILQLGVDGCCNDPALIGERRCADGCEEDAALAAHNGEGRGDKVLRQLTRGETGNDADDRHDAERDELNDRGGCLDLACELRRKRVDGIGAAEVEQHERDALRADHDAALIDVDEQRHIREHRREEHECIAGGEPSQSRRQGRIIDRGQEPAHIIAVFRADRRFGIVHDAIDLFIFLGHTGECEDAGEHDRAADEPCDDAERHITVCDLEDGLCLEENAGTDDNANNHANCGEKAVFAFQFVIHENTSFLKPEMSGANTKRTVEQRDQRTAAWRWKGNRSQRK